MIVILYLYFIIKSQTSMLLFQQNRYNDNNWHIHWILKNIVKNLLNLDLVILVTAILNFYYDLNIILISLIILNIFIKLFFRKKAKKPLVYTKRVKRLFLTTYLLYLLAILPFDENIKIVILSSLIYLDTLILIVINIINKPIEKYYFNYFKKKAIKKLHSLNHTEVIGITGSYGKTSSKNILNDILNVKYNSFKTPKNYNTEIGLILTINEYLDKFNDYFIAEMGALKKGDIKTYCDLVKPKYGILTSIGKAHLETFKSIENIQEGKFELIESLPSDGVGILNKDDELQVSYKIKNNCKIIWVGINSKADFQAINIKCDNEGTTFDCKIDGELVSFKTKLLGHANVYNILASIALGHYLKIPIKQLKQAVLRVEPVEHRLQLLKKHDITIIDDAYNSNPKGFKMALEVLGMMNGKKIIITPGMVELGSEQYELNKQAGIEIAKVCDEVILVGAKQTKPIQDGLLEKKYKNFHIVDTIDDAFILMHKLKDKNTYVLLENDLPDVF